MLKQLTKFTAIVVAITTFATQLSAAPNTPNKNKKVIPFVNAENIHFDQFELENQTNEKGKPETVIKFSFKEKTPDNQNFFFHPEITTNANKKISGYCYGHHISPLTNSPIFRFKFKGEIHVQDIKQLNITLKTHKSVTKTVADLSKMVEIIKQKPRYGIFAFGKYRFRTVQFKKEGKFFNHLVLNIKIPHWHDKEKFTITALEETKYAKVPAQPKLINKNNRFQEGGWAWTPNCKYYLLDRSFKTAICQLHTSVRNKLPANKVFLTYNYVINTSKKKFSFTAEDFATLIKQ